ncbi:MAG: HAD family hydrolase, partial [Opitutales bacterium]
GRDKGLLQDAIQEYDLPVPDVAVGDVGTTIYHPHQNWIHDQPWWDLIALDWNGHSREDLEARLCDLEGLRLQPEKKQGAFKLSFFTAADDRAAEARVRQVLDAIEGLRYTLIASVDELNNDGLLDILPAHATKYHAVRFVLEKLKAEDDAVVFAGDSGNDLAALTSGLQAVLVANAAENVREQARRLLAEHGTDPARLYFAKGDFMDMNGNYKAGVLEGLAHFLPHTRAWMGA